MDKENTAVDNIIEFEGNVGNGAHPRRRFKPALFSSFIFLIVVSVFYFASEVSRLGVVFFDGDNHVSRAELKQLINAEGELFLKLNLDEIKGKIERHPAIDSASVSRRFPNNLDIHIVENEIVVCAEIGNEMFYVLRSGEILDDNQGIVTLCDGKTVRGYDVRKPAPDEESEEYVIDFAPLSLFARNFAQVDDLVLSMIQEIEYAPKYGDVNRFSLFMADGNTVKVSSYTMISGLNAYPSMFAHLQEKEEGQTGIFHLDVGVFFEPYE